jgi:predicted TIM-barrel fold metal-dependent hydrolase
VLGRLEELFEKAVDIGEKRILEMDRVGVNVQVLSLSSPGTEQMEPDKAEEVAVEVNNMVADSIRKFPSRLSAFAALPTSNPVRAADELERTVKKLGFKGALINGHVRGKYLDDPIFDPIFERAEALKVPIYLHPTMPPKQVSDVYYNGNLRPEVSLIFSVFGWGWHIETAVHLLRLILAGTFDKHPELQVMIGHLGEALPFMLDRLDQSFPPNFTGLKYPISHYLRNNMYYTSSSLNSLPSFLNLMLQVGVDRIMFSTDYPNLPMGLSVDFLKKLPISPSDKEKISYLNACNLMHF